MGIIADILVATPEEVARYVQPEPDFDEDDDEAWTEEGEAAWVDPRAGIERLESKGFTTLEMGFLWADLLGVPWDVDKHLLRHHAHASEEDGGTWSTEIFPDELVDAIVTVPAARLESALALWHAREELRRARIDDLRAFFGELQTLARSAKVQGKGLYLYNVV